MQRPSHSGLDRNYTPFNFERKIMYKDNVIVDRREMLRVKLKSLAEESRIIRREELRTHGALRFDLRNHRAVQVRREARHTLLAYGFIRGLKYREMEPNAFTVPDWERVKKMLKAYGPLKMEAPEMPLKVMAPQTRTPRLATT